MADVTTTRAEQCRKNARVKSDTKCQGTLVALGALLKEGKPISKAAVARHAGVSVVFIRSHPDIVQAISDAEKAQREGAVAQFSDNSKEHVIAALRRRIESLKGELDAKEVTIRRQQQEIRRLYGKLAVNSPLTDTELREKLLALMEGQSHGKKD